GANDTADNNILTLAMTGLFPYAGCEYKIDIHNSGSVPMHLTAASTGLYEKCPIGDDAHNPSCVALTQQDAALSFATAGEDPANTPNANDAACAALLGTAPGQLVTVAGVPVQLHAGENIDCTFKVILDEVASGENSTYYASFGWTAHQWNEPDTAPTFPDIHP